MVPVPVDPFRVIALGNDPCAVGLVLNLELHAVVELGFGGGFRVHIREQLGQIQTEREHMTVVNEGVIVVAGSALPCQNDGVLVALFAVGKGIVGVDNGTVGHTGGVVGVAGVELAVLVGCAAVDFIQTGLGNVHGHMAAIFAVGDGELAGILTPCGNFIGAGGIGEKRNGYTGMLPVPSILGEAGGL